MIRAMLLILIALFFTGSAFAQSGRHDQPLMGRKEAPVIATGCPRVYIGLSTGVNNPAGFIGAQVDLAVSPTVSIGSGVGMSSWGYKTFIEARYYFKPCNRGWAVSGGLTFNTGVDGMALKSAETVYGKQDVSLKLHSLSNFMISGYHFFNLGQDGRNRFHLQFGYSIPLSEASFDQVFGAPLSGDGSDMVLALAPGGLILGLGFSFGVGQI